MDSQKYVLYSVMGSSFIGAFVGSGINVAVPSIGIEFGASGADLSRIVSAFLFGSAMLALPMGRVADILGRRKIYTWGMGLFAIAMAVAGFSYSIEMLYVMRFIQGCVLAMVFGPGMAVLVSVFEPAKRGKMIGMTVASVYTGLSCGPAICGFICHYFGWRSFFFFSTLLVLICLWLILHAKDEWYGDREAPFDYKGSLCFIVAAPLMLYGVSELSSSNAGVYLFGAGVIAMLLFAYIELKVPSPMLDLGLFINNIVFTFSNLASLLHYSGTFAISFLLSLYLQVICGMSAPAAGMIILLQPIVMALLSPKAGALSDRYDPGKVASIGMAINMVMLVALSFMDENSPLWLIGILLMLVGLGFALFSSPNSNAIMSSVSPKFYGTASSMMATMRIFGQAISMAIVTMVMDSNRVASVTNGDSATMLYAIQVSFRAFAIMSLLGIGASLVRNGRKELTE